MFWFLGCEGCGILAPQPGIEPAPPPLEGKVLTTGLPGKSLSKYLFNEWRREWINEQIQESWPFSMTQLILCIKFNLKI